MTDQTTAAPRRYSLSDIFTYTGVSKLRIFYKLIALFLCKLTRYTNVTATVNSYKMKLDLRTPGLSKVLFVYGTRELPDISIVKKVLKPGMIVADIGANIGYYTLLEAELVGETGHVYAFEPDPRNLPLLRHNVALNHQSKHVTIYEQAVADVSGTQQFQLGERTNVSSFVDRPGVVDTVSVSCIALPEFEHIDRVDMLRMDAEGYESKIIEGVIPYLRDNLRPFSVMLEVHPKEYNDTDLNFPAQLQKLFDMGFRTEYVVANAAHEAEYGDLGYNVTSRWTETRHTRLVYESVRNDDVIRLMRENKIRAMYVARR